MSVYNSAAEDELQRQSLNLGNHALILYIACPPESLVSNSVITAHEA